MRLGRLTAALGVVCAGSLSCTSQDRGRTPPREPAPEIALAPTAATSAVAPASSAPPAFLPGECSHAGLRSVVPRDELSSWESLPTRPTPSGEARIVAIECEPGESDEACRARAQAEALAARPGAIWVGTTFLQFVLGHEAVVELDGVRETWREADLPAITKRAKALAAQGRQVTIVSSMAISGSRRQANVLTRASPEAPLLEEVSVLLRLRRMGRPEQVLALRREAERIGADVREVRVVGDSLEVVVFCSAAAGADPAAARPGG